MSGPRIVLVGEANPYSPDPEHAMLPWPEQSAGAALCRMIGCGERAYLRAFARRNLCGQKWSMPVARAAARLITIEFPRVVLLGAKVAAAFGKSAEPLWEWFPMQSLGPPTSYLRIPHPSGLSRAWNEPGARGRVQDLLWRFVERQS